MQIIVFVVVLSSAAIGLLLYALSENIDLYYPPADIAAGKVAKGQQIRAGGMVRTGSIKHADGELSVQFVVTDYQADLTVHYQGILPDLFAEDSGVVVTGVLDDNGELRASEVLAKHDENYMPPEVAESLQGAPAGYGSEDKPIAAPVTAN